MKKFIRCTQGLLLFIGASLLVLPADILPAFYQPRLMAFAALIYSCCIELPVYAFRIPTTDMSSSARLVARTQFQVAIACGFLLGGLGSLGLWEFNGMGIPYDKFVHFIFSTLLMVFGAHLLGVWHAWSLRKSVVVMLALIAGLGVIWECIELVSDRWLHFGYFGKLFDADSLRDVITNISGALIGVGVVVLRAHKNTIANSLLRKRNIGY